MPFDSPVITNGGNWCHTVWMGMETLLVGIGSRSKSCAEIEMPAISTGASGVELDPAVTLVSVSCATALTDLGAAISRRWGVVVCTSQWVFAPCNPDHALNFAFTIDRYHLNFEWLFRIWNHRSPLLGRSNILWDNVRF